jgi:hypothetical protein
VDEFNQWVDKVQRARLTESFQDKISIDRNALYTRLTECVKETCDTCINPKKGVKPDKKKVSEMTVMIEYAFDLSKSLNKGDKTVTNWTLLSNQCSKAAGLPLVHPTGIAADGGGAPQKATCP